MSGSARPRVDVRTTLDAREWRELYLESLRLSGFWVRTAAVAVAVVLATATAVALQATTSTATTIGVAGLGGLAAWTAGYVWAGPWLRYRRVGEDLRTAHWRVEADRILTERPGGTVTLEWNDVDRLVLTRRLLVVQLGDGGGVFGLPRRTATEVGEALIARWAEDSGAEVLRRRSA